MRGRLGHRPTDRLEPARRRRYRVAPARPIGDRQILAVLIEQFVIAELVEKEEFIQPPRSVRIGGHADGDVLKFIG